MTATNDNQSPSQAVAKQIMERFVNQKLLTQEQADGIESRVASGKMQADDWKLEFEKALGLHRLR